jgi:hypothetical protein
MGLGRPLLSTVRRSAIFAVGRLRLSLMIVTITGVIAAAIGVPSAQRREVTIAAVADEALAIASVRIDRRRSSARSLAWGDMRTRQGSERRRAIGLAFASRVSRKWRRARDLGGERSESGGFTS